MSPDGAQAPVAPGGILTRHGRASFEVHLDQFDGPFDLLLGLIGRRRLDVTEIALAAVTDEFMAHLRAQQESGGDWDLSETTEFLLVAATLLDLKASRLLPRLDGEEEDLELIEARDLLFARLLQYRAFKEVAGVLQARMETVGRAVPRQAGLDAHFANLLPELVLGVDPEGLARCAALAMIPKPVPQVPLEHLHAAQVSVSEQAQLVSEVLRARERMSFEELVADTTSSLVVVVRFLVLLELFREGQVVFEQEEALGPLLVCWSGEGTVPTDLAERLTGGYDETSGTGGGHDGG